jgi:hypothetical protein
MDPWQRINSPTEAVPLGAAMAKLGIIGKNLYWA